MIVSLKSLKSQGSQWLFLEKWDTGDKKAWFPVTADFSRSQCRLPRMELFYDLHVNYRSQEHFQSPGNKWLHTTRVSLISFKGNLSLSPHFLFSPKSPYIGFHWKRNQLKGQKSRCDLFWLVHWCRKSDGETGL